MGKRIAEYAGMKEEDLLSVRILDAKKDLKKYIMEGDVDKQNILKFIERWEKGKLKLYLENQRRTKRKQWVYF